RTERRRSQPPTGAQNRRSVSSSNSTDVPICARSALVPTVIRAPHYVLLPRMQIGRYGVSAVVFFAVLVRGTPLTQRRHANHYALCCDLYATGLTPVARRCFGGDGRVRMCGAGR